MKPKTPKLKTSDLSSAARARRRVHVGIDLGDKKHAVCVLDTRSGETLEEVEVENSREELLQFSARWPKAAFVMEAGTHSPWISRLLKSAGKGHETLVANPRKTRLIWKNDRKCDRQDAHMLAKIGRFDPELLHPIEHQSEQAQFDMVVIKSRDALVRTRTSLVNTVRGLLKSFGHRVPSSVGAAAFARKARIQMEQELPSFAAELSPLLEVLDSIQKQIRGLDLELKKRIAEHHPKAARLQRIPGVGPVTALCFELVMDEPGRFGRIRDAGAYLGLVPKRDQSGELDKQLSITRAGNAMLRRLLMACARWINGAFGRDCDLRRHGQKLKARGGRGASGKAAVGIARKLAVTMSAMLRDDSEYRPFANPDEAVAA